MNKRKSKSRSATNFSQSDEQVRHVKDYQTPFQDEHSANRQSWFHELVEWQTKVLFPNILKSNEHVESIKRTFWTLRGGEGCKAEAFRLLAERALKLFGHLDEQHERMDSARDLFERVRAIYHDLSDNIECTNEDMKALVQDLRQQSTEHRKSGRH